MPGQFITFEGGEGSGKTTQSKRLLEKLRPILANKGIDIIWTREPGGSPGAEEIRSLLVQGSTQRWTDTTEALLMFAARDDHWKTVIQPILTAGTWVICDRFSDSTMAYQGYGKGLSHEFLQHLYQYTIGDVKPNRTYLLDIPVEIGLKRAVIRSNAQNAHVEDRFEKLGLAFHERVNTGFRTIATAEPDRFCVLDATQDIDTIEEQLWADAQKWLEHINV